MTALRVPTLPEPIRNELARLKGAGLPLLPLGGGADDRGNRTAGESDDCQRTIGGCVILARLTAQDRCGPFVRT